MICLQSINGEKISLTYSNILYNTIKLLKTKMLNSQELTIQEKLWLFPEEESNFTYEEYTIHRKGLALLSLYLNDVCEDKDKQRQEQRLNELVQGEIDVSSHSVIRKIKWCMNYINSILSEIVITGKTKVKVILKNIEKE